jgi:hypothetical protein
MGGRGRLSAGMPRLLGNHHGAVGLWYRRAWCALVAEYGEPVHGSLAWLEAGRVAAAFTRWRAAQAAWADAQRARSTGKGRRPSPTLLSRLQKRAGIEEESYTRALDRLRGLLDSRETGQ